MADWKPDEVTDTGHSQDEARAAIAPLVDAEPGNIEAYLVIALPREPIPGRSAVLGGTSLTKSQAIRLAVEWLREAVLDA